MAHSDSALAVDGDDWFTLTELTNRLGALVWVEEHVADLTADWSSIEASPAIAVFLATVSGHHRWHGEIIRGCLPTSPMLLHDEVVAAPTAGWAASIETLRTVIDPEASTTRLKALARVIDPWLDREIGALQELARPVSDAPMMRWLRFATLDHDEDGGATAQLLGARSSQAVRFDEHTLINELSLS